MIRNKLFATTRISEINVYVCFKTFRVKIFLGTNRPKVGTKRLNLGTKRLGTKRPWVRNDWIPPTNKD